MRNIANLRTWLLAILLLGVVIWFMGPLAWFLILSIRPATTDFATPPNVSFLPSLWAYMYVLIHPGQNLHNLLESVIEAGGALVITGPVAIMAAYGFSRFRFRGRRFAMLWLLTLLLTPPVATVLPNYILMNSVRLINTPFAMMLMYQTFTLPLSIWLLRGFFNDVPIALEEAAMVDGATRARALFSVVLPLAAPGILVSLMFAFVFSWNNTIFPLALSNTATQPLPIGTLDYFTTTGVTWNYIAAASMITVLPCGILFFLFRKYIVKGLTFGAVTG